MTSDRANRGRISAHCGTLLHCLADPGDSVNSSAIEYIRDGVLLVCDGRILEAGDRRLLEGLPEDARQVDHSGKWIVPGFIDCHVHYPQTHMIASYGEKLLDWLETYTYPTEEKFSDPDHALDVAVQFVDELLRNGTTTAMVFATVHPQSVDAIFEIALSRNMRLMSGKVMMDRNCPETLRDTATSAYKDSRELLLRWHGTGRLAYAITPRFAPTSTPEQLQAAARLAEEFDDVYVHSHLAETLRETRWARELFPDSRSYLEIYRDYDLLRERSVYAHCIHLDATDRSSMADCGAAAAFCPSSNLFLGSGLFNLAAMAEQGVRVGMGTDIGAGTSFNMLDTASQAYKVLQLQDQRLSAFRAFYLVTLGAANALYVDDKIGNFAAGKEADFVVIDRKATPLMKTRMRAANEFAEELFALLMLGDDRVIRETYVMGDLAYRAV